MRLNLGCGEFPARRWVNVDSWPGVRPDVAASLLALPFRDRSASRVYAGHVLEHLDYHLEVPDALAEVRRVLTPGGRAVFVTPDCDRATGMPEHHGAVHGGHRWPGDEHKWAASESRLLAAVQVWFPGARAVPIGDVPAGWPVVSRAAWQCAVIT